MILFLKKLKRCFFVATFLLISLSGYSQKKPTMDNDTVVWNENYRVVKSDFKGKPTKGNNYGLTASGILLDSKEESGRIVFVVQAVFYRSKSSLNTDSEYGLKHERGHFDISEIFARRLRQRIAAKDYMKSKKMIPEINAMYKQVYAELNKEQNEYDRETEHSINREKQEFWNKKIETDVAELNDFGATEMSVMKK